MSDQRRIYRLRFSLSSLLLLTIICAVVFSAVLRPEMKRRKLIKEIESLGGTIQIDERTALTLFETQRVARVTLDQSAFKRISPARLSVFPNLFMLTIEDFDLQTARMRIQGDKIELELQNDDSFEEVAALMGLRPSSTTPSTVTVGGNITIQL